MDLNNGSGIGGGAMACPVCTLYLREGISLQKHLDTHPKEQVIEALIKASGSLPQIQQPSTPLPVPTLSPNVPQGSHSLQSSPQASQITQSSQVSPPSPYPIGPIFECPPINTTMMPPQFASFSYQQFVNNGTMMIPQYAMAPPQANQMLQMLYNPYSVYQQQQIPTVQMISPVTTIPTTNRLQRPMVSVASGETSNKATVCTVNESEPKEILPEIVSELNTESERIESPVQPASPSSLPAMENNSMTEQDQSLNDNSDHIEYRGLSRNSPSHETSEHQVACTKVTDSLTVSMNCIEGNNAETVLPDIEDVEVPSSLSLPLHIRPVKSPSNYECQSKSSKFVDTYRDEQDDVLIECEGDQIEQVSENSNNVGETEVDKSAECKSPVTETEKDSGQPEVEQLEHFLVTMMESEMSNQHKMWKEDKVIPEKPISCRDESDICNDVSRENCILPEIDETVAEESEASIKPKLQSSDTYSDCSYHYKHSLSAPASPISRKSPFRTFSVHSEFGSHDNLDAYVDGFDGMIIMQNEGEEGQKHEHPEEIDMEIEEIPSPHTPPLRCGEPSTSQVRSHTPLSAISGISVLKVRNDLSKPSSPASVHSFSQIESDNGMICCAEDSNDVLDVRTKRDLTDHTEMQEKEVNFSENRDSQMSADLEKKSETTHGYHESIIAGHVTSFPLHSQHQAYQQQQQQITIAHENYSLSSNKSMLNLSEPVDSTTDTESKNFSSSKSITQQKQSLEILNISEDAHAGPMNVLEFDGLQILVPSTFISESSQKAVSASSQQSAASSESAGIDEEVKSINMRADETMPARGELSEQESNGCTEQSAWQLYMGHQESSRMSTSYDLMARESWEESEGSDNEIGGPLLDSRSLATHFTSSLFLDRDRKTPTKRTFKCSHCSEVFDCPKERRVHSTTVHKEAGPSSSGDRIDQPEVKDIKLLDGRMNVFEDIFVPGLHVQQVYQQQNYHQQQQQPQQQQQQSQPLLHQLQPPAAPTSNLGKIDSDRKLENLTMPSNVEVICMICNQRFVSEKSLQIHHRRMHVNEVPKRVRESAKCQVCNEEFPSVVSFNAHLKIHPLECGQCGKYFYRKQNFKLHLKRHLGIKPFPCTVCDKAFLTKQKLDEHTNGHTGNAPVKCNLCNETFRRYSNLTQHKNRHHLNIKKKLKDYVCHCGEVFHTKKKLAWHKETHDEKPKACTYCNERFIHMASLTRHMRRAHNRRFVPDAQRESENVECPICKCIYLRSSLAVHMRVHNGERPYECQVCSKAFSTKWNLQLHKWTHAARSTKPFKCNQCSAAFYRHSDYTAHMNSHRNVRPYTCNYCGAQFIRKYNCLRHVKEHEENKAYTCDVCNKTFHRSYYLKEHLRVHSGARPYTCHICGKSSGTKSNHNKHVRIHHAREPVNTEN